MRTSKKQKIVGSKPLIDPETGELVPCQIISINDRDFSFHKVWLQHLVNSLDSISNQKLRLAFWIIDHLNSENQLTMTQRQIAEKSGMSLSTVMRTMAALQEGDPAFLVKINLGVYTINPDVVWKGSHNNRMGVVFDYQTAVKAKKIEETSEEEPIDENQTSMFDNQSEAV